MTVVEGAPRLAGPSRIERRLAVTAAALVVTWAAVIVAFAGYVSPLIPHGPSRLAIVPTATECLVAPIVGLLVLNQYPRHRIGWLLVLQGLLVAPALNTDSYAAYAHFARHDSWPAASWTAVVNEATWPLMFIALALIGLVFPTGRFLSRRWQTFAVVCIALQIGLIIATLLTARTFTSTLLTGVAPPTWRLSNGPLELIEALGSAAVAALLIGSFWCARLRLKRAEGEERLQLLWFATAAVTIPGGLACCVADPLVHAHDVLTYLGITVLGTVIPAAIGVAILRRRLFDVEVVLSRALTYGLLTGVVIAVYAGVLLAFHAVLNDSISGLIAIGVVAVAIQPVHTRLRRRVERLVYGDRSNPYAAIRRLSQRVEGLASTREILDSVTASIAEALRVTNVWLHLDGLPPTPVDLIDRDDSTLRMPLEHQGRHLGDLYVEVPRGRDLSPADSAMLDELTRHASTFISSVRLTFDLQQSRSRIVTAREEERRRLRRDLHDGVGPSLAAMVLKLNAVSRIVDDQVAEELLTQVRSETRAAIGEIRRLVDNLRPPALDEVGLVGALRQRALALSESPLVIEVISSLPLPNLPAAIEVAAYRIATEAMTNTARHAAADWCVVRLTVGSQLELEIADNGVGVNPDAPRGIGISSMHERAEEVGGRCSVTAGADGGTVVRAVIPTLVDPLPRTTSSADLDARSDGDSTGVVARPVEKVAR
jgi:two-component system NarL family sensor kinase